MRQLEEERALLKKQKVDEAHSQEIYKSRVEQRHRRSQEFKSRTDTILKAQEDVMQRKKVHHDEKVQMKVMR